MIRIFVFLAVVGIAALPASAQSADHDPYGVRLHVGMWSLHLGDPGRGLESNWLVALSWRGLFGGTFVNSFGDRAFTAGLERSLARSADRAVATGLGYRLGLVTGYDGRLMDLAAKSPVLPLVQLMGDVTAGRTGVELAWAGKVATLGPHLRFAR